MASMMDSLFGMGVWEDLNEEQRKALMQQGLMSMAANMLIAGGQGKSTAEGLGGGILGGIGSMNTFGSQLQNRALKERAMASDEERNRLTEAFNDYRMASGPVPAYEWQAMSPEQRAIETQRQRAGSYPPRTPSGGMIDYLRQMIEQNAASNFGQPAAAQETAKPEEKGILGSVMDTLAGAGRATGGALARVVNAPASQQARTGRGQGAAAADRMSLPVGEMIDKAMTPTEAYTGGRRNRRAVSQARMKLNTIRDMYGSGKLSGQDAAAQANSLAGVIPDEVKAFLDELR